MQVRGVVRQLIHPGLFKTDVADAEVGFALGKVYKLLRVGSYVSGLLPLGTILMMLKLSPAMASVK